MIILTTKPQEGWSPSTGEELTGGKHSTAIGFLLDHVTQHLLCGHKAEGSSVTTGIKTNLRWFWVEFYCSGWLTLIIRVPYQRLEVSTIITCLSRESWVQIQTIEWMEAHTEFYKMCFLLIKLLYSLIMFLFYHPVFRCQSTPCFVPCRRFSLRWQVFMLVFHFSQLLKGKLVCNFLEQRKTIWFIWASYVKSWSYLSCIRYTV